jgi:hypothetical protein
MMDNYFQEIAACFCVSQCRAEQTAPRKGQVPDGVRNRKHALGAADGGHRNLQVVYPKHKAPNSSTTRAMAENVMETFGRRQSD